MKKSVEKRKKGKVASTVMTAWKKMVSKILIR